MKIVYAVNKPFKTSLDSYKVFTNASILVKVKEKKLEILSYKEQFLGDRYCGMGNNQRICDIMVFYNKNGTGILKLITYT